MKDGPDYRSFDSISDFFLTSRCEWSEDRNGPLDKINWKIVFMSDSLSHMKIQKYEEEE